MLLLLCVVQVWDLVPGALQESLQELVGEKDDDAVPDADVSANWGTNSKQAAHNSSQPTHLGPLFGLVGMFDYPLLQPGAKHTHSKWNTNSRVSCRQHLNCCKAYAVKALSLLSSSSRCGCQSKMQRLCCQSKKNQVVHQR